MEFNQDNKIVRLCTKGIELEGQGELAEASTFFNEAWKEATNDFEKFTAAHYVARHQKSISDKLKWDEIALKHAVTIDNETVKAALPSLYLNIGKCYEDLNDFGNAKKHYHLALSFISFLPANGYGKMITSGINSGLDRINSFKQRSSGEK